MRGAARNFVVLTKVDPLKALLIAWPLSLIVQTGLDLGLKALGGTGPLSGLQMMFSPWQTCRAFFLWLTGGDPLSVRFLYGQADIGRLASLSLAGCLMIFEPLFWAGLAVVFVRLFIRARHLDGQTGGR